MKSLILVATYCTLFTTSFSCMHGQQSSNTLHVATILPALDRNNYDIKPWNIALFVVQYIMVALQILFCWCKNQTLKGQRSSRYLVSKMHLSRCQDRKDKPSVMHSEKGSSEGEGATVCVTVCLVYSKIIFFLCDVPPWLSAGVILNCPGHDVWSCYPSVTVRNWWVTE